MIQPYWEPGEQLPEHVRTRFRLHLSFSETDGLDTLCAQMKSLHPSIIFALRKIRKLSVRFETAEIGNGTVSFEKSVDMVREIMTIVSRKDENAKEYFYRVFDEQAMNMPRQVGRTQTASNVTIGLPISSPDDGSPLLDEAGQFVFAFLPVVQMKELPFLVHADFILTGSRQAISDNAWNKALRSMIATLFCTLVKRLALEGSKMSYEWLTYIPLQPMAGFLQPLSASIREILSGLELLFSMNGSLFKPRQLRILTSDFTHQSEALMSDSRQPWSFLSKKYKSSDYPPLLELGTSRLNFDEAFELIEDDLRSLDSRLRCRPLSDAWHDTFIAFIKNGLAHGGYRKRIHNMPIIPVRVNKAMEWHRPGPDIFFPHAVNEGTGVECILIEMPADVDLVVLRPEAATAPKRREVYLTLGVQQASSAKICAAITIAMIKPGPRYLADLLRSMELLFWFSYTPSAFGGQLKASTSGGVYGAASQLFMHSREQYHAERLVQLDENPNYGEHFLDTIYQSSKVATRSRGGKTWEQWLVDVAGVRWFPPLQDLSNREKLHWILDTVHARDSILFLSVIQTYWAQEYSNTCRFNTKLGEVLRKCQVLCEHGKTEELSKSWFPTQTILYAARQYGVEKRLPILSLPNAPQGHLISAWPALRDLGIRYDLDLWFYRQTISLLSATGQPPAVGAVNVGWLYKNMANLVTLEDRETIQVRDELLTDTFLTITRTNSRAALLYGILRAMCGKPSIGVYGRAALFSIAGL